MEKVNVRLRPLISRVNLPTVLKTAALPGDSKETLFIATQVGEIFYIRDKSVRTFLDIRPRIAELGASGGYDERGLVGMAFHPEFYQNGLFYLHYTVAGVQGPGALPDSFTPDPCEPESLNLRWTNRDTLYDHIDTVEEWFLSSEGQPYKWRTLLNIRRPFSNHNGVNSLNFSPETGKLVLTTGDGGSGYDPFNLSQDIMEIAGKIIEIDTGKHTFIETPPAVTRFDELPVSIQETLTVIAKGVRNIPGISFQRYHNQYIKYAGNVGQDFAESIYAFGPYAPILVSRLVKAYLMDSEENQNGLINFGWRAWEGIFPTPVIKDCSANPSLNEKTMAYYDEAVSVSIKRLQPITSYYHNDSRQKKFSGTALTGVQSYMGNRIPALTGSVVFTDLARREDSQSPVRGVLAYTRIRPDCMQNDYSVIQTDYDFGSESAYYVSLGTNLDQTRLYLGIYESMKVTDYNQGTVFEVIP